MSVKDFLYDEEVVKIKKQHEQARACEKAFRKRYADRLKAMSLLNDGHSFTQVAEIPILNDDTVRGWHHTFDNEGYN